MRQVSCGSWRWPLAVGLLGVVLLGGTRASAEYTFTPIVFPDATLTVAFGINNAGAVIVGEYGCCVGPLASNGFVLAGGSFTTLEGFPDADATNPTSINDSGEIAGIYIASGVQHGFKLSGGEFTSIDFPAADTTQAWGINNAGEVVGIYVQGGVNHGFVLSGETYSSIDVPGAAFTGAQGINDAGDIVGSYGMGGTNHGFIRSGGVFTTIDVPGAVSTDVFGINNVGQIVGRYQSEVGGRSHGFLLSEGVFTTIDVPGFVDLLLYKLNDAGDMVGQVYNTNQFVTQGVLVSPARRALSVTLAGQGAGTVTSDPEGIQCPEECSHAFTRGITVTLIPVAGDGSVFAGWTGEGCGTGIVTLNADTTCVATFHPTLTLTSARVWVGLANSDAVGLKLDLTAKVSKDGQQVGSGQLLNVSTGGSGFNNAVLRTIPLSLSDGPVSVPAGTVLTVEVLVRNTCAAGGHNSGTARLWYNGQPIDSGTKKDPGSRLGASVGGESRDYFLRSGGTLNTTAGSARTFLDKAAGPKCSTFKSFGIWSVVSP